MHKAGKAAIAGVREAVAQSTASSATHSNAQRKPLPTEALDLIAATMTSAFGHRWTSAHGDDFANTSGRVWAQDLAGITRAQLMRGLDTARRNPEGWPPVLTDFRAFCLGVVPLVEVDANLTRPPGEWLPFSVLVKRQINESQWRMSGPDAQQHMLERAWNRAKAHLLAGGGLPAYTPAAQQLTKQDHVEPPPPIMMTAADCIESLRREFRHDKRDEARETPVPKAERDPESCIRCNGTRKDPDHRHHPLQTSPGECIACYGSGVEHAFNRVIHPDGTIEDRLQ